MASSTRSAAVGSPTPEIAEPPVLSSCKKKRKVACRYCGLEVAAHVLVRHERTHTATGEYSCAKCDVKFCRPSERNQHERRLHKYFRRIAQWRHWRYLGQDTTAVDERDNQWRCPHCLLTYPSRVRAAHLRAHTATSGHQCRLCSSRFGRTQDRDWHERTKHNYIWSRDEQDGLQGRSGSVGRRPCNKLLCRHCGVEYPSKGLASHERTHLKGFGHKCGLFGSSFTRLGDRERHELTIHNYNRYAEAADGADGEQAVAEAPIGDLERTSEESTNKSTDQAASEPERPLVRPAAKRSNRDDGKCEECGISLALVAQNHVATHAHSDRHFICSVCGSGLAGAKKRRLHELHVHNFERDAADRQTKKAVDIREEHFAQLRNLPTNFALVQSRAVPSKRTEPIPQRTARDLRQAARNRKKATDEQLKRLLLLDPKLEDALTEEEMRAEIEAEANDRERGRPRAAENSDDSEDEEEIAVKIE